MSWEVKKSITRIFNTFKRIQKNIYPEDVEALKVLNDINDIHSKNFTHGNLVFAKLYALSIRQNLHYYGDIKTCLKAVNENLSKSLDFHLQMLTDEVNTSEFLKYLKSIGIDPKENFIHNSEKGQEEINKLKENEKEIINKLKTNWSLDNIQKSFYKSVNDVLRDLNNYC